MKTVESAAMKAAKNRADRLIFRLEKLGIKLTRGQSLEALAAVEGFEDWNRLSASLEGSQSTPSMPFSVVYSKPGDGTSILYRFHALNVLDRFPRDHVVIVAPFDFSDELYSERWKDLQERLVVKGPTTPWPSLDKVKGKVVMLTPPPNFGTAEELSQYLDGAISSWKAWKGHSRTRAFFGLDIHRYSSGLVSAKGLFSKSKWPLEVRLFTQHEESLVALAQPGLEAFVITKWMAPSHRAELAKIEANITFLSEYQGAINEEDLRSFEGLTRLIAMPIRENLFPNSIRGPLADRMLSILQEERAIHHRVRGLGTD